MLITHDLLIPGSFIYLSKKDPPTPLVCGQILTPDLFEPQQHLQNLVLLPRKSVERTV